MQKHKTSSRVPKGSDGAWGEDQRTSMGQKKEDAEEEVEAEELIELIILAPLAEIPDLLIS